MRCKTKYGNCVVCGSYALLVSKDACRLCVEREEKIKNEIFVFILKEGPVNLFEVAGRFDISADKLARLFERAPSAVKAKLTAACPHCGREFRGSFDCLCRRQTFVLVQKQTQAPEIFHSPLAVEKRKSRYREDTAVKREIFSNFTPVIGRRK